MEAGRLRATGMTWFICEYRGTRRLFLADRVGSLAMDLTLLPGANRFSYI